MGFKWQLPKKVNCRTACTSRLQLRLADGKSLLSVNSVRSVSKSARFIAALTIQSSLNDNQPADCKSRRYALRPPERHLTIHVAT